MVMDMVMELTMKLVMIIGVLPSLEVLKRLAPGTAPWEGKCHVRATVQWYNGTTVRRYDIRQYDSTMVRRTMYDIQRYDGMTYGSTTAQWYDVQCTTYNGTTVRRYDSTMVQQYIKVTHAE